MATFYDHFCRCAENWPQHIALEIQRRDGTESYTYSQTRQMAESLGRWLCDNRFGAGARCAILADNHPRWAATFLGIIAAGCTAVPLDTALHADQITKLLKDSGAALVFCDAKNLVTVEKAAEQLPIKIVLADVSIGNAGGPRSAQSGVSFPVHAIADLDSIFAAGPGNFVPVASAEDGLASLLYTSGTTADPKGVMLTHANLLGEVEAVLSWAHLGPDDALLGVLPLFHVLSQMANLLFPLVKGSRVVYLETLNTTELVRALQERGISAFVVVPQFFYLIHERIFKEAKKRGVFAQSALQALMMLNRVLRKLGVNAGPVFFGKVHKIFGDKMRYLVTGGSRFDRAVGQDFHALGIDVLQAYGLTETSGGAFVTDHGDNVIGSVGKPFKGVEAKIVGAEAPEDGGPAVGEICIRGALVMKGYWQRPDATAEVLKDGWLHTGDLGYFDAQGNLFITGRRKEVIVLSNGKNVYPEEVEAHYLKSVYIKELCVMGLEATPGDPKSEKLHAVVVLNFDVLKQRKVVNAKEVLRYDIEGLSTQLPSTKRIGSYEICQEDLPRTTTRKLKRFEIERRVKAQRTKVDTTDALVPAERPLTREDTEWLEQSDVQKALVVVRDAANHDRVRIGPNDNLELDLGLDSMQRVELLVALEKEIGGDVEESRLGEIYTVRQLVDAVRESAVSGAKRGHPEFAGWEAVLSEGPTDPEVLALVQPRPMAEVFWFSVGRLAQMLARDLYQMRVSGLENIPDHGTFILCSNHQSFIDPVVLAGLLPWNIFRNTFAVGTSEIFGFGIMRALARQLRVVVVDPDANLVPAMRAGAFGLRHGRILILYPEGERSIDGPPKTFKKGAAILSVHMQVPIVPIAIDGFYEAWPRGKNFFQKVTKLKMRFGQPIHPPAKSDASETVYAELTAELKARVMKIWEGMHKIQENTNRRQEGGEWNAPDIGR